MSPHNEAWKIKAVLSSMEQTMPGMLLMLSKVMYSHRIRRVLENCAVNEVSVRQWSSAAGVAAGDTHVILAERVIRSNRC